MLMINDEWAGQKPYQSDKCPARPIYTVGEGVSEQDLMSAVHVIGHFGNESFRPNGTDKQTQNGLDKTGKMKKRS